MLLVQDVTANRGFSTFALGSLRQLVQHQACWLCSDPMLAAAAVEALHVHFASSSPSI